MRLSARRVETAGPGKHNDGHGLMLLVKESGARSWVLRCQVNGRRRDVGLGSWPDVTLAVARDKAIETRRLMRQGGDPVAAKRRALTTCFQDAAAALIVSKRDGWRNAKHAAQWSTTLATYAYPKLGNMDVGAVTVDDVLAVLKPIWSEKPERRAGCASASRQSSTLPAPRDCVTATIRRVWSGPLGPDGLDGLN